jgi:hypothetical protein
MINMSENAVFLSAPQFLADRWLEIAAFGLFGSA